jgi:predicted SprT family Zn-dependent metalloprotease
MARRMIRMPADTDLYHLHEIWFDAERLLFKHGLKELGWMVVFDNTKIRGGECRYAQKEIGVSAHLFAKWSYDHAMQTVLHEIAHALTPGHKHDKVWKEKAIELGHSGNRCYDGAAQGCYPRRKQARNWIGTCPNGHTTTRARAPKKDARYSCGECSPGVFDPRYLRTWEKRT